MTDSHQAIYDAVRSKISNGDIGAAVSEAVRNSNLSHYAEQASYALQLSAGQMERPSVLFRPSVFIDGDRWCALYGKDLQEGVAGFGNSPAEAMSDFDTNWHTALRQKCKRCKGTGAIYAPLSGSDPSCPECDGEGWEPTP